MRAARHLQVVASEGQVIETSCHYRSSGLRRLSDAGLTEVQTIFLHVFRLLCESLAAGAGFGQNAAHDYAARSLGVREGRELLSQTIELLNAVQSERCGDFSFTPTGCPVCSTFLSEEESTTLDLLQAAQHEDEIALACQAQLLTLGGAADNTIVAALELGRFFKRRANERTGQFETHAVLDDEQIAASAKITKSKGETP